MAYSESTIFQRTDSGNAEIRGRQLGLKKSERLVLVTVDGVCDYGQLKMVLKILAQEQLDRALQSLQAKDLLLEIMFPLSLSERDLIDPSVMESFLRQSVPEPSSDSLLPVGLDLDLELNLDLTGEPEVASELAANQGQDERGAHLGMPLSSVISSNTSEGMSVNTRKDLVEPLNYADSVTTIGTGLSSLKEEMNRDALGKKVKLVQVFPVPERRKKKRKSKRRVEPKNTWHIYVYYVLFGLGILLVLYSVFLR